MKQKVKWVGKLPPRRSRNNGPPMATETAEVLNKLKASPDTWFAIGKDEDVREADLRYQRYAGAVRRRFIKGYEFTRRGNVVYGRFVGSA